MRRGVQRRSSPAAARWLTLAGLWSVIIAAMCGFGVAVIYATNRPPDAYALCQHSPLQAAAETLIVVDGSDVLTDEHRKRVRITIEDERDRLPTGGRLVIVNLKPNAPWEPIELTAVCNPGLEGNPLFKTLSRVKKRWRESYAEPIEAAVTQANNGPVSPDSRIIETIAAVLARADFDSRVRARALVVISDMLAHDRNGYSQLKGGNFWKLYQASTVARNVRLDLRGVSVRIDYLTRGEYANVQGELHREFWRRLFSDAGAADVTYIGLQAPSSAPAIANGERIVKRTGRN